MEKVKKYMAYSAAGILAAFIGMLAGCGPSLAYLAVQDGRLQLDMTEDEALAQAGPPELWIAKNRVETAFYRNNKTQAVSISFLDGYVVGYDDRAEWPDHAFRAADEARRPVGYGAVRAGMTEQQVIQILGEPDGYTADNGVETLHWVSSDDADSTVELIDGKVVGYVDVEIDEFTQNIPVRDRGNSTTNGQIRVGMTRQEVMAKLGDPDSVAAENGQVINRYDSRRVFGNDIVYSVGYREEMVSAYWQHNLSMEEDEKEAIAEQQRSKTESADRTSAIGRLFAFLLMETVEQALVASLNSGGTYSPSGKEHKNPSGGGESSHQIDECSCPSITCGGQYGIEVQSCSSKCVGTSAKCSCRGSCNEDGTVAAQHSCECR